MAKKIIRHDDLFEPKITKGLIKELDDLIKKGAETEDSLKDILKVLQDISSIKTAEEFKDFTKESEKLNKAQKELVDTEKKLAKVQERILKDIERQAKADKKLSKVQSDKVKLTQKLNDANSTAIDDNEVLKVQLSEQNKANKELAREKLGLITTYEIESKRLIKLRKQYKDLRLEQGKETKETRKLRKEIRELDEDLKDVDASAGQFQRNVGNYPQVFGNATKSMLATAAAAVGLNLSFQGLAAASQGSVDGSENVRKVTAAVTGGLKQGANVVASSIVDLFNFGKAVAEGTKELTDIGDAFTETSEAAENFTDKVIESGEAGVEIAQSLIDLEKAARPLEIAVAALNKVIGEQTVIAGDGTRSFQEQQEAAIKAQDAQTKRARILIKLASEELRIANLQVAQAEITGGANVEILDAQTAAIVKLQEARNEAAIEEVETEKLLREIKRDRFEKELDFAIDAFDSTKTFLERQIALEDQTFEQRTSNLLKLKALSDSAFQSQIELLEGQIGKGIDFERLSTLEDEKEIRKELIDANLTDEIVLQRILEFIRERKAVTADIADAERDVKKQLQEQLDLTDEQFNSIKQIRLQGRIDAEQDAEANRRLREQALIEQAKFETNIAEENSDERILIAEQLKNDLAAIDRERQKDVEEASKKEIAERKKVVDSIISSTLEGLDKRNEAENASRDAAIEKQETALSVQEERAKKGLTNTLAFEQEQLDKANLERQRELERQAKQQEVIALVQAYLNQFQELSKTEPDTAAFKAFTNTLLAKSVAKGLTGFIEGTELVERDMNGSKFSSGQDGYIAKFDGKERILNPAQNMALPKGMTNAELVQAAQDYSKGNTWGFVPTFASNADSGATTKAIIESNKQVIRAIQDNAASMSVDSEGLMHLVESRVSRGKKELIHFINKKYKMLPK